METSRRTTLKALGALGAGGALLTGHVYAVGEHDDDERDEDPDDEDVPASGVRVAHFAPDAPNVDVFVDDEQVLADVPYDTVSPYLELEPGTYGVRVTAAGDEETVVFDEDVEVGEAFYTLAAIGELEADTFEILALTDAGSALVRLLHASPDAPAVDVVEAESGVALFSDVAFGQSTNYLAVAAGSDDLEVRPAADDEMNAETDDEAEAPGEADDEEEDDYTDDEEEDDHNDDVVATVPVDLEMGTAYTAAAIGFLEPDDEDRAFAVALTVDGPAALEEPDDEEPPADDDVDDEEHDDDDEEEAPGEDDEVTDDDEYDDEDDDEEMTDDADDDEDY